LLNMGLEYFIESIIKRLENEEGNTDFSAPCAVFHV
jgi:hypothetical protein